jgi:hypothetical protein
MLNTFISWSSPSSADILLYQEQAVNPFTRNLELGQAETGLLNISWSNAAFGAKRTKGGDPYLKLNEDERI